MKTRARARRWHEEVQLLQEEMRRVLVFFEWKATWWRDLECQRHAGLSTTLCVGLAACAEKQARMYEAPRIEVPEHVGALSHGSTTSRAVGRRASSHARRRQSQSA